MSDLKRLKKHIIMADLVKKLKVITTQKSQKDITKLYMVYVSEDDLSQLPAFLHEIDSVLVKFGAEPQAEVEQQEEQEEQQQEQIQQQVKQQGNPQDNYQDIQPNNEKASVELAEIEDNHHSFAKIWHQHQRHKALDHRFEKPNAAKADFHARLAKYHALKGDYHLSSKDHEEAHMHHMQLHFHDKEQGRNEPRYAENWHLALAKHHKGKLDAKPHKAHASLEEKLEKVLSYKDKYFDSYEPTVQNLIGKLEELGLEYNNYNGMSIYEMDMENGNLLCVNAQDNQVAIEVFDEEGKPVGDPILLDCNSDYQVDSIVEEVGKLIKEYNGE